MEVHCCFGIGNKTKRENEIGKRKKAGIYVYVLANMYYVKLLCRIFYGM